MKKYFFTAILVITASFVFSQHEIKSDIKYKFGFSLGANYSFLHSKEALPINTELYNGIGAKVGLFMDYSITKNFIFSPKAEFAFNKSGVENTNNENELSTYKVFPLTLDLMPHFFYKFGAGKRIPYILLGPNFRLPLKNKVTSKYEVKNKPDIAIDFGIGLENKLKYFSLAPELRYSFGLLNINKDPFIKSLNYHNIALALYFK